MANKVIIGILIFLVVIGSGLGAYSYTLSQQIKALSVQMDGYQKEQIAQIGAVSDEVTALSEETMAGMSTLEGEVITLEGEIGVLKGEIGVLKGEVGTLEGEVGALGDEIGETLTRISTLEDEIKDVAAELSQPVINADKVYQGVRHAIVGISDGERTVGSGFIFDTTGHVVTAQHVVDQLPTIYVILSDGRSSRATVVGGSQYSDIAVLALADGRLVVDPLILADSALVRIGEPVVAIGSPFDQAETLTAGIVSQTSRFVEIEYDLQTRWVASLIQFDAAVNFGNSGGPLLNSEGEVIGIVVARVNPNEGDGINYAVASNKIKRVVPSLIERGYFDYPWFGVEVANLTPKIIEARMLETTNGVLIRRILPNSPAEVSGLRVDDVIVAVDTVTVRDVGSLNAYLGEYKSPGELVLITVIRGITELEVSLEVGRRS